MSLYKNLKNETFDEKRIRRADSFMDELLGGIRTDPFSDYAFSLSLETKLPYGECEPSQYLNQIEGTIRFFDDEAEDEDEFENGSVCGRLHAMFVNFEQASDDGVEYFPILDSLDDEFIECAKIFNSRRRNDTHLTKAAQNVLTSQPFNSFPMYDNFVYVKRLEILAEHRGKRLGTFFLYHSLQYLARTLQFDFFAMKPFPLQKENEDIDFSKDEWHNKLELHKLEKNWNKALLKLRDLYGELGFDLVKGTDLMICSSEMFK